MKRRFTRYFRCTGCYATILPGPYLTRRIIRHLADWEIHNHDALEHIRIRCIDKAREAVDAH